MDDIRSDPTGFRDLLSRREPIEIEVDYYDKEEARRLAEQRLPHTILEIAGHTIALPIAEFLTNCLFVNKREGAPGLSSRRDLETHLREYVGDFNPSLILTRTSLCTR